MRYETGDLVYVRSMVGNGMYRIVGIETKWQGCVERLTHCKIKTKSGVISIPVEDILTEGEAVAENLSKGL